MSLTAEPSANQTIPVLPIQPLGDTVIVWSKSRCVQCDATCRALTDKGIDHEVYDLALFPDAVDALRAANFLQAPAVQFREDLWTGFRPDKIDEIKSKVA